MTKPPLISPDPLVMKIRKILRTVQPRKQPTEKRRNQFGYDQEQCPYCGEWCYARTYRKASGYNMHFAHTHADPFWKEKRIIKLFEKVGQSNEE